MAEDLYSAEGLDSRRRSPGGGLGDDRLDQLGDPVTVLLGREMPPAGQGRERHDLGLRELADTELLAALARFPFFGAIEPGPLDRLAGEERRNTVNPWPILGPGDQVLLAAVRQDVGQAADLSLLFVADENGLIAA